MKILLEDIDEKEEWLKQYEAKLDEVYGELEESSKLNENMAALLDEKETELS